MVDFPAPEKPVRKVQTPEGCTLVEVVIKESAFCVLRSVLAFYGVA
jgi:hypothetical protein